MEITIRTLISLRTDASAHLNVIIIEKHLADATSSTIANSDIASLRKPR